MTTQTISSQPLSAWGEFLVGVRAQAPILLGTMPFGMIYGALAVEAGLAPGPALAMSSVLFAGSAQFVATGLYGALAPAWVLILTAFALNLRHMLYSASLAPYVRHLPQGWKIVLSYLLTDEAYATTIVHYNEIGSPQDVRPQGSHPLAHWFFLGAALTLWSTWQLSTAVGIYAGALVPESWSLDFTLALTFIALVMPTLIDRAALAAALSAGGVAVLAYNLPYNLGLIAAALTGVAVGLLIEGWAKPAQKEAA